MAAGDAQTRELQHGELEYWHHQSDDVAHCHHLQSARRNRTKGQRKQGIKRLCKRSHSAPRDLGVRESFYRAERIVVGTEQGLQQCICGQTRPQLRQLLLFQQRTVVRLLTHQRTSYDKQSCFVQRWNTHFPSMNKTRTRISFEANSKTVYLDSSGGNDRSDT